MYSCEKEIILNVDIEELFKSLDSLYDDDRLIIKTQKGQLELIFEGIAKRTFKLKLEDKNYKPIKMPNIENDREKCELPFGLLNDGIIDADKLHQTVKLSLDSNYFKLDSKGGFLHMNVAYLHGEKK
ncbi:beta clamp domain-containing protein [Methanobrevibacter arboriphilus]|uniref:hypothetical protein n=1 Tax=Methanobrevibacter arboriphilus TaxID=39441 RepID=UPI000A7B32D0|nr:hypothetical protein [Methanobrevibacter arboriphilus]